MSLFNRYRIFFFAFVLGVALAYALLPSRGAAAGDDGVKIISHKALYDFKLGATAPGASISGIRGQMYYEQEDVCDAWTTDHRFTTQYQYAGRPTAAAVSHFVAYESKDGKEFSFSSDRKEDGDVAEQLRGAVEIAADGSAQAVYARPEKVRFDLPKGYLLPMAHNEEVIRYARAGDAFFRAVLFDGSDADGPVEVGAFIGRRATAEELKKIAAASGKIDARLMPPEAWHVRMAIFPLKDAEESMPSYEMEMILHENGVISYARIDYRTYSVEQYLVALEKLPPRKC